MKTFELNVLDRLTIMSILPKEGDLLTLKTVKDLKAIVSFKEEEVKDFELRIEDNRYLWNSKGIEKTAIDFSEAGEKVIKDILKKLDTDKKLTEEMLSLCDIFEI